MEASHLIALGVTIFASIPVIKSLFQKRKQLTHKKSDVAKKRLTFIHTLQQSIKKELFTTQTYSMAAVPHLFDYMEGDNFPEYESPLGEEYNFVNPTEFVIQRNLFKNIEEFKDPKNLIRYIKAGPRRNLVFNPAKTTAAIADCGRLCPGQNVVVREIVMNLYYNYGVKKIFGVPGGLCGFYQRENQYLELTPENVMNIHTEGGSFIEQGTDLSPDIHKIVDSIQSKNIQLVFIMGGWLTSQNLISIHQEIKRRKLIISICLIPKSADNYFNRIDRNFGFDSATEEACRSINTADVEANSFKPGIGIIQVSGWFNGFIAVWSSLANRNVNVCLIPESPFELDGPKGLLSFIEKRCQQRGHAVIVLSEGAGVACKDRAFTNNADFGFYLAQEIKNHFLRKNINPSVKFINPTYMIRSVIANSQDKIEAAELAISATHGAMAGYTSFAVGRVSRITCYLPIKSVIGTDRKKIDTKGPMYQRLLASTGQPTFLNL